MKKHYIIKAIFTIGLAILFSNQVNAQFRITEVDPSTERVTIKNFGSTTEDISAYRLCAIFSYNALSDMTLISGDLVNFAPNAEVELTVVFSNSNVLSDSASDLGLYLPSGSFGSAANMVDFMQYGGGGIGRENVAVSKGIWTAGSFVSATPPYEYIGSGTQNGFQFWDTLLGINDFNSSLGLNLYPNPTNSLLNIELKNSGVNLTFQVFDILGKQVINGTPNSEELLQIDVSNLESGLYIIKIASGDKNETKRFIKN